MPNFTGLWTVAQQLQAKGESIWTTLPGAPTIGTATANATSNTSVTVTFTAPSSTGYPAGITGYIVTSSPDNVTATGASSPISVTGLTTDTAYTFTVRAINATGTGPASAASNSATPITPLNYVEDVFNTFLYTGGGSAQTFVNDIDLAGKGGLVWMASRNQSEYHSLTDTARGVTKVIRTTSNAAEVIPEYQDVTVFNSNGFTGRPTGYGSASTVFWTFRKQAKFFDIVTYTGDGTSSKAVAHSLQVIPGCIIIKATNATGDWWTFHENTNSPGSSFILKLNTAAVAEGPAGGLNITSSSFNVGDMSYQAASNYTTLNNSGTTYVAYLFARSNSGGFGTAGTDSVVSCGRFTTDGSAKAVVDIGFEPQWVLYKRNETGEDWYIADNMRGWQSDGTLQRLEANTMDVEANTPSNLGITATGFETFGNAGASKTFLYIAIRRPMKVPTVGTSVFSPVTRTGTGASTSYTVGFAADLVTSYNRAGGYRLPFTDRLRGITKHLLADLTNSEGTNTVGVTAIDNTKVYLDVDTSFLYWNESGQNYINYAFRRAPSFFDEVCYTGNSTGSTPITHNLGVVPELIIVKSRSAARNWPVYIGSQGNNGNSYLNLSNAWAGGSDLFANTTPTASAFYVGNNALTNNTAETYVAYLFATCAGVSKVGSYTGTGTTLQVNCGFTAGARFVLIKRTDSTGDWYVWDTTRGIISGNDPYLILNGTAAEVTNTDYIDTYSAGFELSSTAPAALNASGGTYIFLAIA